MTEPDKFLKISHQGEEGNIPGLVACADFELGKWRVKKLAMHLLNWLPHFALKSSEIENIGPQNSFKLLREAAIRLFKTEAHEKRGEIGELLLHIISVTEFKAQAFVSRLFYKMRSNDQVTGFDSALVTYDEDTEEIELWLGEAKFYKSTQKAISAALASIQGHLNEGFLEETKVLIGPKIEPSSPGYHKLQWLFDDGNTLDEIIDRIVVPVLIASESNAVQNYQNQAKYDQLVVQEYEYVEERLRTSPINAKVKVYAFYVPLGSKKALVDEFIDRLEAMS